MKPNPPLVGPSVLWTISVLVASSVCLAMGFIVTGRMEEWALGIPFAAVAAHKLLSHVLCE